MSTTCGQPHVVMRMVMVVQWLRASRYAGSIKHSTYAYAAGIVVIQVIWVLTLLLHGPLHSAALVIMIFVEVSLPLISERLGRTPWHPHHITERYSLFTLIVLGESLLGSANAIIESLETVEDKTELLRLAILALVATASLWWIYFWPAHHRAISILKKSVFYGYTHYFIFAAAGAFSAGIELEIDVLTGHSEFQQPWASFAYTVPIAVFILGVWLVAIRSHCDRVINFTVPVAALLVLIDPIIPVPFALTVVILVAVVVVLVVRQPQQQEEEQL